MICLLHFEDGIFPAWLNAWIGSFMISAFYWSCGWLTGMSETWYDWRTWWNKRRRSLVVPYLWFSAIILAFDLLMITIGEMPAKIFLRDLYKTAILRGIGPLWFIPALLGGEAIFRCFITGNVSGKMWILALACCGIVVYRWWDASYGRINELYRIADAPLRTMDNILNAWWVIAAGYLIAKRYGGERSAWSKWRCMWKAILLLTLFSILLFLPNGMSFAAYSLGPFGIMLLTMVAEKWRWLNLLEFFGVNSLIVMATHYSILQEICICLNRHITGHSQLSGFFALLYFGVCMVCEIPIIWGINRFVPPLTGRIRNTSAE